MKTFLSKKFWLAVGGIYGLLALPRLALADSVTNNGGFQSGLGNIQNLFPQTGIGAATTLSGPGGLIYQIISILLFVAGSVAVIFVIVGGFQYVTSAGNEEQAEKGRQNVTNAIIGIIIIILSYVVVNVIYNLVSVGS